MIKKKYLLVKRAGRIFKKINVEALNNIPISAKKGDNIASKSKNLKWYKEIH